MRPTERRITVLEHLTEQCPHCLQDFALVMEYRCESCDGPLCPFCAAFVEAFCYCTTCKEAGNAGPGDLES